MRRVSPFSIPIALRILFVILTVGYGQLPLLYFEFYWQLLASGGHERHLTVILVKGAGMSAEDINGRALFICRVSRPYVSSGSMSEFYDPHCFHAVLYQVINGDS